MRLFSLTTIPVIAALAVAAGLAIAVTKETSTPKTFPFSAQEQGALMAMNTRIAALQQEQRAVAAERQLIQVQANQVLDQACKSHGAENCSANTQGADPSQWTLVIAPKGEPKK